MTKKHILAIGKPCYLKLKDNCLEVRDKNNDRLERIVLEEIEALILDEYSLTITLGLLRELLESNVLVVICSKYHMPIGVLLPLHYQFAQTKVIHLQTGMTKPLKKRLWQCIVQVKIKHQALALKFIGNEEEYRKLLGFSEKVLSGDTSNMEAQAARFYFKAFFGKDFKRDTDLSDANMLLNFSYTLVRSITMKALIGTGLNPSLGVFHHGMKNPFCLADDFVEVLRPLCDLWVYQYVKDNSLTATDLMSLEKESKQYFLKQLGSRVFIEEKEVTLMVGMSRMAESFKKSLEEGVENLVMPEVIKIEK